MAGRTGHGYYAGGGLWGRAADEYAAHGQRLLPLDLVYPRRNRDRGDDAGVQYFLDSNNGVINNLLKALGKEPVVWQYSVSWGIFWIVVYSVWKGVGGAALIWLAGLQSVDVSLYEAAEIDGAGRWGKLRYVTLPGLKPIATYIVITNLIAAIQIYEQVLFITNGGHMGKPKCSSSAFTATDSGTSIWAWPAPRL